MAPGSTAVRIAAGRQGKVETDTYSWQYKGIGNLGVQTAWSEHHECVTKSKREVLGVGIWFFGGLSNFTQIFEARVL
jgi:hypothetical protein